MTISIKNIIPFLVFICCSISVFAQPDLPSEEVEIIKDFEAALEESFKINLKPELPPVDILDMYNFSEPVKAGILNLFSMWGLSPHEALGYIFPLYVYRMTNTALCSGGSHRLSSAIHKAIIQNGGTISDKSTVVKVLNRNGRVEGVLLDDGTEIKTKAVASTVDPQQNFLQFFNVNTAAFTALFVRWHWRRRGPRTNVGARPD